MPFHGKQSLSSQCAFLALYNNNNTDRGLGNLPNHRQQKLWGKEYIRTGGVCVHKTVKAPFTMATEVSYSCACHVSAQQMYPPLNFAQLDSGYHQVARIYKAQ